MNPPLVLILAPGGENIEVAVLAAGGMPVRAGLRGASRSELRTAGLAKLAERVDAVYAGGAWDEAAGAIEAARAAHQHGTPVLHDLDCLRAWIRERSRSAVVHLAIVQAQDADELPPGAA